MEKETAVEECLERVRAADVLKSHFTQYKHGIGDRVKIQRWLEIYWSVGKNQRRQGWEAVSCSSGSGDNRAGWRAGGAGIAPPATAKRMKNMGNDSSPLPAPTTNLPGCHSSTRSFQVDFCRALTQRDNNLITSRDCLRQDCCQSQLPKLPVRTYVAASTTQIRRAANRKKLGLQNAATA